jgi:hypothetical protein
MLKDRRILLEQEIVKVQTEAANMYLSIVVGGGDVHSEEYQKLRNRAAGLQFDLKIINDLIRQGQE